MSSKLQHHCGFANSATSETHFDEKQVSRLPLGKHSQFSRVKKKISLIFCFKFSNNIPQLSPSVVAYDIFLVLSFFFFFKCLWISYGWLEGALHPGLLTEQDSYRWWWGWLVLILNYILFFMLINGFSSLLLFFFRVIRKILKYFLVSFSKRDKFLGMNVTSSSVKFLLIPASVTRALRSPMQFSVFVLLTKTLGRQTDPCYLLCLR